jgi:PAS domain S-box-containing protein
MDSPEQWESLLRYTQDKVAVVDGEGTFSYVNEAAERVLGYDRADILGTNAFEYVHPDDRARVVQTFRRLVGTPKPTSGTAQYRFAAADGSWVPLESRMSNCRDSAIGGYIICSRDISVRRELESRLAELAANAEDVLWMFSPDFDELHYVNDAYETIWGRPVAELRSDPTSFLDGVHPEDRPKVRAAMERLAAGNSVDTEYRVNEAENFERWVWVKGTPVARGGDVARVVGFARDVTERRARERHLRNVDRMLRHNLRNELNLVVGYAEMLRERPDNVDSAVDAIAETVDSMVQTAEKQREIVGLLSSGRSCHRVNLSSVLDSVVASVRRSAPDATVDTDVPQDVAVYASENVGLAVRELLDNAVEHADVPAPTVDLTVRRNETTVDVTVSDTNPRIPEQERELLLERRDTTPLYHGSGLGMELVYWVVDRSRGDIDISKNDPRGNVVTLTLPRPDPAMPRSDDADYSSSTSG